MPFRSSHLSLRLLSSTAVSAATVVLLFGGSSCTAVAARSALPVGYVFTPAPALPVASLQERLRTQDDLLAQQYNDDLRTSPEGETAVGDYHDNAKLDDYSLRASARQNAADRAYLARIRAIPTDDFPEQDRISHQLFTEVLEGRIADYELKITRCP